MNQISKMKPAGQDEAIQTDIPTEPTRKKRGKRVLLMIAVPLALLLAGGWFWLSGGRYQETENAYLHQAKVTIASNLSGRVTDVEVADNQRVKAGDLLFTIDTEPYRLALAEADAAISSARLQVEQLKASYKQSVAQEGVERDEVDYLQKELERQQALAKRGVATTQALDEATHDLRKSREQLSALEQATASARAALGGTADIETDDHPMVRSALAARDRASYNLEEASVRAPADGIVYRADDFRKGQFVSAGEALFSLVENRDVWVDANFKETQLTHIRPGQSAEVEIDIYPGRNFPATVEAIGAGTGAEFSLLPAQNATGNWVKVTQRVPVRLRFDGTVPADIEMISGASAKVSVDTGIARTIPGLTALAASQQ